MTLQTLADRLGISRTTASNAFNRPDQLNPALRERVLALAAELGYAGPDPRGRALRSGRAGAIGVLLTEQLSYAFADPAAVATLRGLAEEAERVGISLSLLPAPLTDDAADPSAVSRALVDGCFVYALPADHPSVHAALERHLPLVVADTPHIPGVPFVSIDDRAGARAAARASARARPPPPGGRLAAHARRRAGAASPTPGAAAIPPTGSPPSASRATTRRSPRAGLSLDEVPIYEVHLNARTLAREAVPALLEREPTAVLGMSDEIALGVIDGAVAAGLDVPHDLSVVGFDDVPGATPRRLTTVRQPLVEKGRTAGRMLLEAIEGGTPSDVVLPTELVVRDSATNPRPPEAG